MEYIWIFRAGDRYQFKIESNGTEKKEEKNPWKLTFLRKKKK